MAATVVYYHVVDSWFGLKGSNNSYRYTQHHHSYSYHGPPHSFPMLFGSDEPFEGRRSNWSHAEDSQFIILAAILLFLIRRFIVEKLVRYYLHASPQQHASSSSPSIESRHMQSYLPLKTLNRIQENAWFACYHIFSTTMGLLVLKQTPWLFDPDHCIHNYPDEHTGFEFPYMREYLLIGAAFYVQALVTLLFVDEKMKDFLEMLLHHLVTIGLLIGCITTYYHRVGTLVLLLHDCVDVFFYISKCSKYLNVNEKITTILFALFALSYLILRLTYLPYLVMKSLNNFYGWDFPARYYLMRFVSGTTTFEMTDYGICFNTLCTSTYWILISLLVVLIGIHLYWFSLILKIIYKRLCGVSLGDIRERDVVADPTKDENNKNK